MRKCEFCGKKEATHKCVRCGKIFCEDCGIIIYIDEEKDGICYKCLVEKEKEEQFELFRGWGIDDY